MNKFEALLHNINLNFKMENEKEDGMNIGILGSGAVGVALAKGFIAEGHEVWLATRKPDGDKGDQLRREVQKAIVCDFATAAKNADLAVLCVKWAGVRDAVQEAGPANLAGKVVIDTSNLIRPQEGGGLAYDGGDTSGGEQVQAWLPDSKVVKAFNTTGADNMYRPDYGDAKPTMFIAGDDGEAKKQVGDIVTAFGWDLADLGNLKAARLLEPMALVWINYRMITGTTHHAFRML